MAVLPQQPRPRRLFQVPRRRVFLGIPPARESGPSAPSQTTAFEMYLNVGVTRVPDARAAFYDYLNVAFVPSPPEDRTAGFGPREHPGTTQVLRDASFWMYDNAVGYYLSDTFARPNSLALTNPSSSLGVADTGQTWKNFKGNWHIFSNAAVDTSNGGNEMYMLADCGFSDFTASVTIAALPTAPDDGGLAIRIDPAFTNFILLNLTGTAAGTGYAVYGFTGGAHNLLATITTTPAAVNDVIKVVALGTSLTFTVNGASSTVVTSAIGQTNTNIGLRSSGNSAHTLAFKNLLVTP